MFNDSVVVETATTSYLNPVKQVVWNPFSKKKSKIFKTLRLKIAVILFYMLGDGWGKSGR